MTLGTNKLSRREEATGISKVGELLRGETFQDQTEGVSAHTCGGVTGDVKIKQDLISYVKYALIAAKTSTYYDDLRV